MSGRLWMIKDWEERAHAAQYCVKELARQCDVSVRTLRRFLHGQFSIRPKDWMRELRMERARAKLAGGKCVYETAADLGYRNAWQFSRAFRNHHGYPPSDHVRRMT